jgi:Transport protein Avl9
MQGEYYAPTGRTQLTPSRGPEIEFWLGVEEGADPAAENDWSLLPFMALSDGAHA